MKYRFLLMLLLPLVVNAQSVQQEIRQAEQVLRVLQEREDSVRKAIEALKFRQLRTDLDATGLPALRTGDTVIYHTAFALVYSEAFEQAKWVAHVILPDVERGSEGRSNDFRPDPLVSTGSAVEQDYFLKALLPDSSFRYDAFGYDRGHLAPSADFRYSKKALSESYLYSNMSPQLAVFNRGRWAELEDVLRNYVMRENHQLYVVTGGILKEGLKKIERGPNRVSIPEYYFKVVLDADLQRGIGFILPNANCELPVLPYACSIDSVESLTGIDFFPRLPDALETAVESQTQVAPWGSPREQGDVLPMKATTLPRNTFNTTQAQYYSGRNESIKVCGTVVSTKLSSKGNVFLNLDKKFPNQVFSVSIFKDNIANFSYAPDTFLAGKTICVTGKITNFNGTPTMSITDEAAIELLEEPAERN